MGQKVSFDDIKKIISVDAINTFATNLYLYIVGAVWGHVNVHYNPITDCMEIMIKNRAFNMEPFRMTYPEFSKEMRFGTSAGLIGHHVIQEYESYIDQYIFKRG